MIAMRPRRWNQVRAALHAMALLIGLARGAVIAALLSPRAGAAAPAASVVLEPAYTVFSWWQFAGQMMVMLILSGVISTCLVVAALWLWEFTVESVLPLRRWIR